MLKYYFFIILTAVSMISYHLTAKMLDAKIHPLISVMVSYSIGILGVLILLPFFPMKGGFMNSLKGLGWPTFVMGITIIGIEIGYILSYRFGGNISNTSLIVNLLAISFLIPIGLIFFTEKVSLPQIIGIIFAIIALLLMGKK